MMLYLAAFTLGAFLLGCFVGYWTGRDVESHRRFVPPPRSRVFVGPLSTHDYIEGKPE